MLYFNQIYVRGESNCNYQVLSKLQIIFCLVRLTCSPPLVTINKRKLKSLAMALLKLPSPLSLKITNTKITMICIVACMILTIQKNNLPITLPALCGVRGIPLSRSAVFCLDYLFHVAWAFFTRPYAELRYLAIVVFLHRHVIPLLMLRRVDVVIISLE